MAEDKPMTVKERMAALALASGGSSAVPTPAPRASGASTGPSVAERLAKMRAGSGGGATPSPGDNASLGKKPGLVRTATPHPSGTTGPTVVTQSPAGSRGSSIADRINALSASGSGSSSILPPSPLGRPVDSSTSPVLEKASRGGGSDDSGRASKPVDEPSAPVEAAASPVGAGDLVRGVSPGLAARMEAMKLSSSCSSSTGSSGKKDTSAEVAAAPGSRKISTGLAARMNAISCGSDSVHSAPEENEDEVATPPPPPAFATSGSSSSASKMSPGLAARMGKAIPIPMPGGGMPLGGFAELKRRKQEKEEAERAAKGTSEEQRPSATETEKAAELKPGELQHANLSRATISQRRRPRKAVRQIKAAAATPPAATEPKTQPATSPVETETPPNATTAKPSSSSEEGMADKTASQAAVALEEADPAGKMNSMLRAASVDVAEDDDDEWE